MNLLKLLVFIGIITMSETPQTEYLPMNVDTYTEQETFPEPIKAEAITEPIKAEVIAEDPETTVKVSDAEVSEIYEIDNEMLETCDHEYSKTMGTGGEEGDVWEYVCDKCGDTYYEPYEGE